VIHATVVSFCMPATRAIFTSCFAATLPKPRALSATSSKSLDENGSALFVFGGIVIPVISLLLRDWWHSSDRLSKTAAIALASGSACMSALFPWSGFPLATLGAAGMLVAKPVQVDATNKPGPVVVKKEEEDDYSSRRWYSSSCWCSSGWLLGCVFQVAGVAQCAVTLMDDALRGALVETFANGLFLQSENPGMCSMYTQLGTSGLKWIGMHSLLTASQFWCIGSLLQDWALRANKLRKSTAYINFGANLTMSFFCVASGYWGGLAPALSMLVYERRKDSSSSSSTNKSIKTA